MHKFGDTKTKIFFKGDYVEFLQTICNTVIMSAVSIFVLFLMAKLIGNKQLSEINLFDYINSITIGSIAAELASSEPRDFLKPLIAIVVYGLATVLISLIASKSRKARKILAGKATVIMDNDKIYRSALKKTKLDLDEFLGMLRVNGFFDLSQVKTVILEANGRMSILPKAANRPFTPNDANVQVNEDYVFYSVIMDGIIMEDNLRRAGKDKRWLMQELKKQGYDKPEEVFLACCDMNNTLNVYKNL